MKQKCKRINEKSCNFAADSFKTKNFNEDEKTFINRSGCSPVLYGTGTDNFADSW